MFLRFDVISITIGEISISTFWAQIIALKKSRKVFEVYFIL